MKKKVSDLGPDLTPDLAHPMPQDRAQDPVLGPYPGPYPRPWGPTLGRPTQALGRPYPGPCPRPRNPAWGLPPGPAYPSRVSIGSASRVDPVLKPKPGIPPGTPKPWSRALSLDPVPGPRSGPNLDPVPGSKLGCSGHRFRSTFFRVPDTKKVSSGTASRTGSWDPSQDPLPPPSSQNPYPGPTPG